MHVVGLYFIELLMLQVTANELTNGVINAAFMLLFKDLIRLFACYNDGIINLLGKQILSGIVGISGYETNACSVVVIT